VFVTVVAFIIIILGGGGKEKTFKKINKGNR